MILAVDVQYSEVSAVVAGVTFADWDSPKALHEYVFETAVTAEYCPGEFYRRELPCILELLDRYQLHPDCIIVDGFVFLDGVSRPGLGKHLYDALTPSIPIIGVAKSFFNGITSEFALLRGESSKPLYVTAIGMPIETAREHVLSMHGKFRFPTLLRRVDQLSKGCDLSC